MRRLIDALHTLVTAVRLTLFFLRGGDNMVAVYVALITYQCSTIDAVPAQLKEAVLANLTVLGLDGYGNVAAGE